MQQDPGDKKNRICHSDSDIFTLPLWAVSVMFSYSLENIADHKNGGDGSFDVGKEI